MIDSKKALMVGISGTILQWYDFALFGYFAPIIAALYFPKDNAVASLLHVFGMFAVGYLLAPMGALVFGYIGDRYGRKRALTFSILGMAIPTLMIGCLPGFHTLGLVAPILITLLRIGQGFVASAEFSGSAIFLVEHAPPGRTALYGCLTSAAYSLGVIFAGLVATCLTSPGMPDWAWRLGFVLSSCLGFIIFTLRRSLIETPLYQHINEQSKPRLPIWTALRNTPQAMFGVVGLACLVGVVTFGTYVFMSSYLHRYFEFSLSQATLIVTMALAVDAVVEPLMAILADRVGHVKILVLGMGLIILSSLPIFYLITSGSIIWVSIGMALMSLLIAIAFAPMNAYMVMLFPGAYRYSGFGVAFHVGISIFGGTAPLVLMWWVEKTGNLMSPAYYFILSASVGLAALLLCERSRKKVECSTLVFA